MSYPEHLLRRGVSYFSAEVQSVYSTAPAGMNIKEIKVKVKSVQTLKSYPFALLYKQQGGTNAVTVILVENGLSKPNSNTRWGCLHSISCLMPLRKAWIHHFSLQQ